MDFDKKNLTKEFGEGLLSNSEIEKAIAEGISSATIVFAEMCGTYLALPDTKVKKDKCGNVERDKWGKPRFDNVGKEMTTSQLRKFFGEVKRQQISGYKEGPFVMLKPKLAYAVGRAKKDLKGEEYTKLQFFYAIIAKAVDVTVEEERVGKKLAFKNFISLFEAIVAYHKAAEITKSTK